MPQTSSQPELDARFAVFLNPIRDLTKNWEVDISKYLEEYLEELAEIRISFDGGETMMNFAEAAMLIQGSAAVYCKKVEFLWQMVCQMLDLLSSKNIMGDKKVNVETSRQSKVDANVSLEFEDGDVKEGRNIDLKEKESEDLSNGSVKFLPKIPLHLVEKESEKPLSRIPLSIKNTETFGNKEDFFMNRSYLSPNGVLCLDIPKELLRTHLVNSAMAGSHSSTLVNVAHEMKTEDVPLEEPLSPQPDDIMMADDDIMEPLTEDIGEPPPMMSPSKESCVNVGRSGLRERAAPEVLVAPKPVPLVDPWKALDPHLESPSKRPVRAGRIRKPLPCSCHKSTPKKSKRNKTNQSKDSANQSKDVKLIVPIDCYIASELASLVTNNNTKMDAAMVDSGLLDELDKENAKRWELTKNGRHKQVLEQAKHVIDQELSLNTPLDEPADSDFDGIEMGDMDMPDPHEGLDSVQNDAPSSKALNDSLAYEPSTEYEALVQKWVCDYVTTAQDHVSSSDMTQRVNRWKKIITPALAIEDKRQHFDIHHYGSHVLSFFPEGNSQSTFSFEDIVKGEDQKEVSRIFLSCLMLANTRNVDLEATNKGDLQMDCLQLRIMSRVRHHKQLEEYAAPSQALSPRRNVKDKRKKDGSNSPERKDLNITSPQKKSCR